MKLGKRQIIQLLNRNVVANVTMVRVLQIACFAGSALVLVLGIVHLAFSELTGRQIVLSLLLASFGPLLFLGAGIVLPVLAAEDTRMQRD